MTTNKLSSKFKDSKDSKEFISVILSAGEGTRMKSEIPKVLHEVLGKAMVCWVIDAVNAFKPKKNIVVVGYKAEDVKEYCYNAGYKKLKFALQEQQLGSADAVKSAFDAIGKNFDGDILVLCGDVPLLREETIKKFLHAHRSSGDTATILTARATDPHGYGRIKRDEAGNVCAIVEEKDATHYEKEIREINSGLYCFSYKELKDAVEKITPDNAKNEYYLTDAISIIYNNSGKIGAYMTSDFSEILGVNDKGSLSQANQLKRDQINYKWIHAGVNIPFPNDVYIESGVKIGKDATIHPGTVISSNVVIGKGSAIGPNSFLESCSVGSYTEIKFSYVTDCEIGNHVKIGPFSHIRPKTKILDKCKVGNFTEIKGSLLGKGSKASHLSYIGDAQIGKNVNVGAGTITCNYDGVNKHKTVIEDNTFIGSNTNLVAPVFVGKDSVIAAGSTIDKNVPQQSLAIARSRQKNKIEWVKNKNKK